MCRNGREYSVVLQMAEVFVIHMALKVHPQGLRESVSLARARVHVYVRTLLCVHVCMSMCVHFCACKCVCLVQNPQC